MMHLWSLSLMIDGFHLILRWFFQVVLHTKTKAFEGTSQHATTQFAKAILHLPDSNDDLANASFSLLRKALGTLMIPNDD